MATTYVRTQIMSFSDLSEKQQEYAQTQYDWDESIEDSQFVEDPRDSSEVLHLGNFMRSDGRFWSGIEALGHYAANFIKIGRDNESCIVAYRHF